MDKHTIITLKNKGRSNREVARLTGFHRKTVSRYWNEYQEKIARLADEEDPRELQEQIYDPPTYDSTGRIGMGRKYTPEMDNAIDEILEDEKEKSKILGRSNKQRLTNRQIHKLLRDKGYDIGLTTVTLHLQEKRRRIKEAFIRQEYDYGDRLEYDFGEVRLVIAGKKYKFYIAVLASPAGKFRWAYLYTNQKKDVFMDSHVRFFEMTHGVYREVAYDNMKNVVTKFIGRNEKELNADLIKMSLYYGFSINVTNCFSGNEKGYVERSVDVIRNEVFAPRYRFDSFEEAEAYLELELTRMNAESNIEEEIACLSPYRPKLELAKITEPLVDKYSFIRIDNNFYSVPDYLVGTTLTAKIYYDEIIVYSGMEKICTHKKVDGVGETSVNIFHYLDTLTRKPGALPNSKALKSKAELKTIYDKYFTGRSRDFIDVLKKNKDKPIDEIVCICEASLGAPTVVVTKPEYGIAANVRRHLSSQLARLDDMAVRGGGKIAN